MNTRYGPISTLLYVSVAWIVPLPADSGTWIDTDKLALETIERARPAEQPKPKQKRAKPKAEGASKPVVRDKHAMYSAIVGAMITIKENLRDPDSVVWEYAGATAAGDTICITYRAKNGFGGYNRSLFIVDEKGAYDSAAAWNRRCAGKTLTDFTYAKRAVP